MQIQSFKNFRIYNLPLTKIDVKCLGESVSSADQSPLITNKLAKSGFAHH